METKEEFLDYLQSTDIEIGFQDLYDHVINKEACVFCGACVSLCPRIGIKNRNPTLIDRDSECSLCFKYCARTYFPEEMFEKEIFKDKIPKDLLLGHFQHINAAKSTNKDILKVAQDGGIVTTLLIHALNTGLIDGVLLADRDDYWVPKPIVVRSAEEILAVAGSIYTMAPTLLSYSDAVNEYKLEKLGFVGMPCQIQAVRKLQLWPPLSEKYGKFTLIIGLYCTSNYSYDLMEKLVQDKLQIQMNDIDKFDISRGKFIVYTKDGQSKQVPIKETKKYNWSSCQYCKDYTAEFADISVGSVGKPEEGWNSVIIRSEIGKKLFDDAINAKKIITVDKVDISKIKKEALKKKSRIKELDEKVFSAVRFLDISELEIKTYAIIVSLGYSDLSILSRVMKIEKERIQKVVNSLIKRKWIIAYNGFYKPINPTKIIKDEIDKFKRDFRRNIERIKNEALIDLETLFEQNNLMYVNYKEYLDEILDRQLL
ncbi:MAG: Coenzyme F420 hydrogenase/dehydrogenase, beta subunit C-terminal domain [Promethearchaeota archaeon]